MNGPFIRKISSGFKTDGTRGSCVACHSKLSCGIGGKTANIAGSSIVTNRSATNRDA